MYDELTELFLKYLHKSVWNTYENSKYVLSTINFQEAYDDYIYIKRSKNRKEEYRLFNANCITWTKHHFDYLKSFLLGKQLGVYTGQGPPKSFSNFDNFE